MLPVHWGRGPRKPRAITLLAAVAALAFLAVPAAVAYDAPDPRGSQGTAVSVPPPAGEYFGYHALDWGPGSLNGWGPGQLVQVAKGGGANAIRFDVDWQTLEPKKGQWNEGA